VGKCRDLPVSKVNKHDVLMMWKKGRSESRIGVVKRTGKLLGEGAGWRRNEKGGCTYVRGGQKKRHKKARERNSLLR